MYYVNEIVMGDTVWKFQNFSASQTLREINVGYFEAPKSTILNFCYF